MTETEWLACTDPEPMLDFVGESATERKLRLFGVACCQRTWRLLTDERSRAAVEVAERYANGEASEQQLREANCAASEVAGLGRFGGDDSWGRNSFAAGTELPARAAAWAATWRNAGSIELCNAAATAAVQSWDQREEEFAAQANLLRCILGPLPFRLATVDASWRTATVVSLSQAIYQESAFERLPILADALEDAGCADPTLLSHCRGPGPHARGCFVVDLLLGKE